MCGVLGIYLRNSELSVELFQSALVLLKHRGPDHQGIFISNSRKLFLGHTRLSILDQSYRANQPMEDGSSVITYNGEIYNHQDLRSGFNLNIGFKTTSDTETLLRGLKESGTHFFSRCLGMYAGAFYEEKSNELMLFRDPLGIKNLFYYRAKDFTVFSSEIKSIFHILMDIRFEIDHEILNEYLTFENYAEGKTLFKGVYNLLPGQIIRIDANINFYLDTIKISKKEPIYNSVDYIQNGRIIIEDSVKRHLLSDYPVGVYLSGGIDSSLVASLAVKNRADVVAFTGFFKGHAGYYDERHYSRLVANYLKLDLHEIEISSQHFESRFDQLIYHLETPKMGMGAFSQFIVAEVAAKYRRVILAGHGGDELFAGYPAFKASWMLENFGKIPKINAKELPWIIYFFVNKFLKRRMYFAPQIFKNSNVGEGVFWVRENDGNLERLFRYYQSCYIPGLLEVEDKVSMGYSLETRVPLWDLEVLNFAQTVPIENKLQGGVLKSLLREIATPFLPQELFKAPKRGFPTPLRFWFRRELFDFVYERLIKDSSLLDAIMEKRQRKQLLKSLKNNRLPFALDEIRAHKIWMLLGLESVERQFGVKIDSGC